MLLEFGLEAAILYFDVNSAFGEGVVDGAPEGFVVAISRMVWSAAGGRFRRCSVRG